MQVVASVCARLLAILRSDWTQQTEYYRSDDCGLGKPAAFIYPAPLVMMMIGA